MDAPPNAATGLAEVVDEGIKDATDNLATKQDLELLRLQVLSAFHEEMTRQLRWLLAAGVTIGGAIIALLIALIARGG